MPNHPAREVQSIGSLESLPPAWEPTADSRGDVKDKIFVCIRGQRHDGHQDAADALRRGAAAVVVQRDLGLPRQEVVFAMEAICDPVSLYEPVYSDGGESACVMDQIGDTKNTDEQWLEQIALEEAIKRLSQREKHILALRFYDGRTQMEVAREVGISQAQVSRLEKNAINQIKKNISA